MYVSATEVEIFGSESKKILEKTRYVLYIHVHLDKKVRRYRGIG